jgi:hypothetical protein
MPRSSAAHIARDFVSAINVFREPPTDGLEASTEENKEACLKSHTCARLACVFQLLFSLLLLIGTIMFTKDSVLALPVSPIVEPKNAKNPTPALVSDLFARAASGDIASLSCPCSRAQHAMGNVTAALDFKMDSFADAYDYPKTIDEMEPFFNSFFAGFGSPGSCVQNLTKLSADLAAVLPDLLHTTSYQTYASDWMVQEHSMVSLPAAICEFAFGMRTPKPYLLRSKSDFHLRDPCSSSSFSATPLLPSRFSPENAKDFPFLQAERGFVYINSIGATLSTLSLFASQLRDASKAATFSTQSAVSPEQLQQLVKITWEQEFESAGALAGNLVPGFFAGEQKLFETNYAAAFSSAYYSPGALSDASILFSNPLPFGRADFGPSAFLPQYGRYDEPSFFYVIAQDYSNSFSEFVTSAGQARLRISVPSLEASFSYPKANTNLFERSVFVHNDFITLLDACANNDSLSVELLSFFPTFAPAAPSLSSNSILNVTALNREQACAKFPPPAFGSLRPPFLTINVTCPAILVELGKKRRTSKLSTPAFNSHLRSSMEEVVLSKLSPLERSRFISLVEESSFNVTADPALYNKSLALYLAGFSEPNDLRARAAIMSTLLIDADSVNVTADPLKYYASCAPALCAWIETSTRSDCKFCSCLQ